MNNLNIDVKGNVLAVTVPDLTVDLGLSTSGKTHIVASSGGGVKIAGKDGYFVNVTVYRKAAKAAQ